MDKKKQFDRQNRWLDKNRERQTVILPLGTKEKIRARGETVNGFINRLIQEEFEKTEPTS